MRYVIMYLFIYNLKEREYICVMSFLLFLPPLLLTYFTNNNNNNTENNNNTKNQNQNQKNRLDEECAQLVLDIQRIGVDGEPFCTFGDLFDDEGVTDYYEALVGTLKAAKKRNMIHFPGQLLLKGVSDAVTIRLVV